VVKEYVVEADAGWAEVRAIEEMMREMAAVALPRFIPQV
jgi:hypothetical protein